VRQPRPSRQVRLNVAVPLPGERGYGRLNGRALVIPDLQERLSFRQQRFRQRREQPPHDVQTVRTAVEREPRFEGRGHGQRGDVARRNVGQVGQNNVEGGLRGRQKIGLDERNRVGHGVTHGVLAGQVEGIGRNVHGQERNLG